MADDLFSGLQSSDDLIQHIKLMVDKKASTFHVSFGMWKQSSGSIKHQTLIILTSKNGENIQAKIEGHTMKEMFRNVDDFLKQINS